MKVLIWIVCSFISSALIVLLKNLGIVLGGIPTAILYLITFWGAKTLTKKLDSKCKDSNSVQKEHEEQNKIRAATHVKKTPRFFRYLKLWLAASWFYLLLTVLFIVAVKPLPTGYYTFLRIFVSVSLSWSVFFDIASFSVNKNNTNETIDIIILALKIIIIVLFNNWRTFYFTKSIWIVIDILCAVVMLFISTYKFIVIWKDNQIHHKKQNAIM